MVRGGHLEEDIQMGEVLPGVDRTEVPGSTKKQVVSMYCFFFLFQNDADSCHSGYKEGRNDQQYAGLICT